MLHSQTAQHNTASVPEQHPAPSLANHSFPGSRPAMGSQQRPEILPRSKSNQVLPHGYVLTAEIVQTWSLSALQCLPVYSKSPANWAEQKAEPSFPGLRRRPARGHDPGRHNSSSPQKPRPEAAAQQAAGLPAHQAGGELGQGSLHPPYSS